MKKRVCTAVVAVVMMICVSLPCFAIDIAPFWTNVSTATLVVTFSNGQAVGSGTIVGISATQSITATYTVERHDSAGYTYVGSWGASSSSRILNTSHSYPATQGKSYHIKVTATVTSTSSVAETINLTSTDYTY